MYADICREQYKILVSEAFWFVVWVVLTSPVWAGFGCLQVSCVENKRGGMHLPKCNLKTHWLTSDDTVAFFPNLSAFICRYLFIEISRHVVWTCLELLIKLYTMTSTQERRGGLGPDHHWMHWISQNIGCYPQRLYCHQTVGDEFRDCLFSDMQGYCYNLDKHRIARP